MDEFADISADMRGRLTNIQTITDDALAHKGLEEFLDGLLEHVRQSLQTDTAVVLLLDRQAHTLVATAAKGIEEEVTQSVRVPVGMGFAGRVAARRKPMFIDDVEKAQVFNPLLVQRGLRSLLGVPMIAGGNLIGVLHVGTVTPRRFTDDEAGFLRLAAARTAMAVQSLITEAERAGAWELQRSLVPSALPAIPGIELAARYRPGKASVGGDWYDVFTLPSGHVCVVMGDVAGHGFQAAVVMGRIRSALRAYALESLDPAEVLGKLDRKMRHFEPDAMATVLYAVCDPDLGRIRVSSAGHWPPVLATPDGPAATIDIGPDILIGATGDADRRTTALELPPGAVLCFYTDGLIERRDRPIEDRIALLRDSVFPGPAESVSAAVMGALIGRESHDDDVALLVMCRVSGGPDPTTAQDST